MMVSNKFQACSIFAIISTILIGLIFNYAPLFAAPKLMKITDGQATGFQETAAMRQISTVAPAELNERFKDGLEMLRNMKRFRRVPKWVHACDKMTSNEDDIRELILPAHFFELQHEQQGNSDNEQPPPGTKSISKRSVGIAPRSYGLEENQIDFEAPVGGKGSIMFKQPKGNLAGVKKTSFSSRAKATNRYFYSASAPTRTTVAPKSRQEIEEEERMDNVLRVEREKHDRFVSIITGLHNKTQLLNIASDIFADDLRISWHINNAMLTSTSVKKLLIKLIGNIDSEQKYYRQNNNETLSTLVESYMTWIPKVADRLIDNKKKDYKTTLLLTNISKYIQVFNVFAEQANHDQSFLYKSMRSYIRLERLIVKMVCDIEILKGFLNDLEKSRTNLLNILKHEKFNKPNESDSEILKRVNLSHVDSMEARLKFRNKVLLEPKISEDKLMVVDSNGAVYESASEKYESALAVAKPEQIFIGRDILPIELRSLETNAERNHRDKVCFKLLDSLLDYYEGAMINIYPNEIK